MNFGYISIPFLNVQFDLHLIRRRYIKYATAMIIITLSIIAITMNVSYSLSSDCPMFGTWEGQDGSMT